MDIAWSWWRFGWGAAGAIMPEVIRQYRLAQDKASVSDFSHRYIFASVAFVAAAGAVAVAWNDDNPLKCLYVGVSFPVIISAWAQSTPPAPPGPPPAAKAPG